jgi:GDPmannose 4,6-dehydratase
MIVADGYFNEDGRNGKFVKNDDELRSYLNDMWCSVTHGYTTESESVSGFKPENKVQYLSLNGGNDYLRTLDIYTSHREKRIPKKILNASREAQFAFLRGYNYCDGLKKNKCAYEFKNFKTNSATLAQGLYYLASKLLNQEMNITLEQKAADPTKLYYSINLLSPKKYDDNQILKWHNEGISQREIARRLDIQSRTYIRKIIIGNTTEHRMKKCSNEVKKIIDMSNYNGWYCDLETDSGEFFAGIGNGHVHNSPRRGFEFVTRKITDGVAKIVTGKANELRLGNLESCRDWGYAPDYCKAMYLMLQQERPDDYVIATGETHSIQEFVENAFAHADLYWKDYVVQDERFMRPAEVDVLVGYPEKAKQKLGWKPEVRFDELVKIMVDHDVDRQIFRV